MESVAWREFASKVNNARVAQHLSIGALARTLGLPKATVQGWLNGQHQPTPALRGHYLKLVAELGLTSEVPSGLWLEQWDLIEPQLREGRAPFLGLRQFEVTDTDYFFGRAAESERLATVLQQQRAHGGGLVALIGASGAGKSSLLSAGLIGSQCADGLLTGWHLRQASPADLAETPSDIDVVILDQFEDVLALPDGDRDAVLAEVVGQAQLRTVLIAMRSDAFAVASELPALRDALTRPFLIAPLTRAELREVIVGPAELVDVTVAPELVDALLDELAPGSARSKIAPETLPLLSNALLVTWAAGSGAQMTLADYRKVGRVAGATEALAEQVYADLDESEKEAAQRLFLSLVGMNSNTVIRLTSAVAGLDELTRRAMEPFVAARMLTVTNGEVRISHEALIRHWSRLQDWVEEHAEELEAHARLRRAAELWRDTDRDPGALIPVQRLSGWLDADRFGDEKSMGTLDWEFLQASEAHYASELNKERDNNRRLRSQRWLALGLAMVTTAAATLAGVSFVRGEGFRADSESREVSVVARSLRSKAPNLMAQMALVGNGIADTREGRSIVLDAQAMDAPTRWLGVGNAVVAVSPDGELVARADGAGTVTLWRSDELTTSSGTAVAVDPDAGALLAVALAQVDGRTVLAVGGGGVRALWDVTETPVLIANLDNPSAVTAVTFDPQATRVVFGDAAGTATVYSLAQLEHPTQASQVRLPVSDPQPTVSALALSQTGMLFVGGGEGIERWQLAASVRQLASLPTLVPDSASGGQLPARVQALALSPDGTELAAGLAANQVTRYHLEGPTATIETPLTDFDSWLNAVTFNADGTQLAAASSDQTVSFYDVATGAALRQLDAAAIQTGVGFSQAGPVSVGTDGTLLAWSAQSPVWRQTGSVIFNLATDGSKWLAGGSREDGIALWRLGDQVHRMATPPLPAFTDGDVQRGAVAVASNGEFLLGATLGGRILSWPLTEQGAGAVSSLDTGAGPIIYTTISRDTKLVAAMGTQSPDLLLFRAAEDGSLTAAGKIPAATPQIIGFSADSLVLAVGLASNTVEFWSVADPDAPVKVGQIDQLAAMPSCIDLATNSPTIAIGESSGRVSIWDFSDPAQPVETRAWTDPGSSMYSVAFNADATRLMGTSGDDIIWGWDLTSSTSEAEFALSGDIDRPWDVRFIDNGTRFAVAGSSGKVRVWMSELSAAADDLCSRIGDPLSNEEWKRYLPEIAPRPVC